MNIYPSIYSNENFERQVLIRDFFQMQENRDALCDFTFGSALVLVFRDTVYL